MGPVLHNGIITGLMYKESELGAHTGGPYDLRWIRLKLPSYGPWLRYRRNWICSMSPCFVSDSLVGR